jgi:cytidine deaminase
LNEEFFMTIQEMIDKAFSVAGEYKPSKWCESGSVGAAILTKAGNVYTGVCIDTACGMGFCAEHSAVAEMLKHKESEIALVVAVTDKKEVLPPCGRCRELMIQVNKANKKTKVILSAKKTLTLEKLLPYYWADIWKKK